MTMVKKLSIIFVVITLLLTFTGCEKECANGCGEAADPECYAEMCDDCCDYWFIINGCRGNH